MVIDVNCLFRWFKSRRELCDKKLSVDVISGFCTLPSSYLRSAGIVRELVRLDTGNFTTALHTHKGFVRRPLFETKLGREIEFGNNGTRVKLERMGELEREREKGILPEHTLLLLKF